MTLARILVHADDSDLAAGRFDATFALASAYDAHVVGCAVEHYPVLPSYVGAQMPGEVYAALAEEQQRRVQVAKSQFDNQASAAGWSARSEFVSEQGVTSTVIARHGRTADLIVVSQGIPDTETETLPDNVVMESGKPVLVLPAAKSRSKPPGRVLMAWRDTRESARAVEAALPILREAEGVEILTVSEKDSVAGSADIARYLAAHGIDTTTNKSVSSDIPVGDAILNRISDGGFDLLVCGAYGHSRLRETILGGVTNKVLTQCPVPALMAH